MKHPFAVAPPEAATGVVVIIGLVGEAMVMAVERNPFDWTALAGKGAHEHQGFLKP